MRIVMLGAPGSGKGTQAQRIQKDHGLPQVSTGDLLRHAVADKTPLGQKAKKAMDAGELVSDDIVLGMIKERIAQPDAKRGFILDGFPRNASQADSLDALLAGLKLKLDRVVLMDVDFDILMKRLTGRRTCSKTGAVLNVYFSSPAELEACRKAGGELLQREDDNEATIRNRLQVYERQTAPLVDYYTKRTLLATVPATGEVDAVYARLKCRASAKYRASPPHRVAAASGEQGFREAASPAPPWALARRIVDYGPLSRGATPLSATSSCRRSSAAAASRQEARACDEGGCPRRRAHRRSRERARQDVAHAAYRDVFTAVPGVPVCAAPRAVRRARHSRALRSPAASQMERRIVEGEADEVALRGEDLGLDAERGRVLADAVLQRLDEELVGHRLRGVRAHFGLQLGVVARCDRREDGRRAARDELRLRERRERIGVARQRRRDRQQRVVGEQPAPRSIAALRRGLAPPHERERRALRRERQPVHAFDARPHRRRVRDGPLREHALAFLAQPFAAPEPGELRVDAAPRPRANSERRRARNAEAASGSGRRLQSVRAKLSPSSTSSVRFSKPSSPTCGG